MPNVDFAQPVWQFIAVTFFLVPGLNCTWAIERIAGRTLLNNTERLIRAVAWSALVYVLASPWLLSVSDRLRKASSVPAWELIIGGSTLVFVVPFVVGVVVGRLRRGKWLQGALRRLTRVSPAPTAWDFAFPAPDPLFVRVSLTNGRRVAGLFADRSFAGTYPEPRDLFLEEAWRLDSDGVLEGPVPGSVGLLVRQESIEFVELLEINAGEHHGQEG